MLNILGSTRGGNIDIIPTLQIASYCDIASNTTNQRYKQLQGDNRKKTYNIKIRAQATLDVLYTNKHLI